MDAPLSQAWGYRVSQDPNGEWLIRCAVCGYEWTAVEEGPCYSCLETLDKLIDLQTKKDRRNGVEPWPELIPLTEAVDLPPFPLHALPLWMGAKVRQVATELQVPDDLPAALALVALAVAAAKHARVHVRSTWHEPCNLYCVVAMPPGSGKSPAFRAMLGPIEQWEAEEVDRLASIIEVAKSRRRIAEAALAKAEKQGDHQAAQQALLDLEGIQPPPPFRLIADDTTAEKLVELLSEQGGRMALLSTEGGLFDLIAGRYSERANLDVFLQGWAGDTIRVDRIGRGSSVVRDAAITVGLTVQPAVISALSERPELAGRGLTARFMYAIPADLVGARNLVDIPNGNHQTDHDYETRLLSLVRRMADTPLMTLRMDHEATRAFLHWRQSLENRRHPRGDLRPLAEWTTKLESSVARVAGLLHLADGHDDSTPIDLGVMVRALDVGAYWLAHAFAVHDLWGANPVTAKARKILDWVTHEQLPEFTVRDLYRALRSVFQRADDTTEPLQLLTERGYVRVKAVERKAGAAGGRPTVTYETAPNLARTIGTKPGFVPIVPIVPRDIKSVLSLSESKNESESTGQRTIGTIGTKPPTPSPPPVTNLTDVPEEF